ncbi:MAG: hypothetical protein V5A38_01970 [Halolamina sp.]|uniref:hypothetical protein n=1 Tax=Halolamina sp. TaxID=1940283 RepID=UPI002FC327CA
MIEEHTPTERTGRPVSVILVNDDGRERSEHSTYRAAVETIKSVSEQATVAKLETEDGEIVFRSDEMSIEDWENEWKRAKRRLSVDVEDRDAPTIPSAASLTTAVCSARWIGSRTSTDGFRSGIYGVYSAFSTYRYRSGADTAGTTTHRPGRQTVREVGGATGRETGEARRSE